MEDLRNLMMTSLSNDSGKIVVKNQSVSFLHEVVDRQTDKCRVKQTLLGSNVM